VCGTDQLCMPLCRYLSAFTKHIILSTTSSPSPSPPPAPPPPPPPTPHTHTHTPLIHSHSVISVMQVALIYSSSSLPFLPTTPTSLLCFTILASVLPMLHTWTIPISTLLDNSVLTATLTIITCVTMMWNALWTPISILTGASMAQMSSPFLMSR